MPSPNRTMKKRLSPIPEYKEYEKKDKEKGVPGKSKSGRRMRTPSLSVSIDKTGIHVTRRGGSKTRRRR